MRKKQRKNKEKAGRKQGEANTGEAWFVRSMFVNVSDKCLGSVFYDMNHVPLSLKSIPEN